MAGGGSRRVLEGDRGLQAFRCGAFDEAAIPSDEVEANATS